MEVASKRWPSVAQREVSVTQVDQKVQPCAVVAGSFRMGHFGDTSV